MLVRIIDEKTAEEVVPEVAMELLPRPGDVVAWGDGDYEITAAPVRHIRAQLSTGHCKRWVLELQSRPTKSAKK